MHIYLPFIWQWEHKIGPATESRDETVRQMDQSGRKNSSIPLLRSGVGYYEGKTAILDTSLRPHNPDNQDFRDSENLDFFVARSRLESGRFRETREVGLFGQFQDRRNLGKPWTTRRKKQQRGPTDRRRSLSLDPHLRTRLGSIACGPIAKFRRSILYLR